MTHRVRTALAALAVVAASAHGAQPSDRLRELLEPMARFGAEFEQIVVGPNGRTVQSARGTVHLERPGRLRWEVVAPYPQLIVSDGAELVLFDPDLAQATVQPLAGAPRDTPGRLLTGALDELSTLFDVADDSAEAGGAGKGETNDGFVLRPLGDDSLFDHIRLEFTGSLLAGIDIVDHLDQLTRVRFRNQTLSPALEPGLFEFVVPDGVDVLRDVGSVQP
ncbi:MAG: outer membrane lipoprotein chaperone LolA [Gammaproteobacteria bacterium]|nr:outer membrane lipoprotein chaperone LolA [Gammaproteobacteria bacterium]